MFLTILSCPSKIVVVREDTSVRPVELNLTTRSLQKTKNRPTLRHTCTNGKCRDFKAKRLSNMDRLPFWQEWRGRFLNFTISFVFPSRLKRMRVNHILYLKPLLTHPFLLDLFVSFKPPSWVLMKRALNVEVKIRNTT